MDPLINIYATLNVRYPFLADASDVTPAAAGEKPIIWTLYKYFREREATMEADKELVEGMLAWWALHRLGKIGELMGLDWSADAQSSQVEYEAATLAKRTRESLVANATGLASIGALVAKAYKLNSFNTDILALYIKGPSKVPDQALLQIAYDKLPSQTDLEFLAPTLRVLDADGVGPVVKQFKTGKPFPLNGGGSRSHKFTSTSVGYNSFTPSMGVDGCVVLLLGRTGRYIGCFGEYGAVDGAEILYDPSTVVVPRNAWQVMLTKPKAAKLTILLLEETEERAPSNDTQREQYFAKLGY